MTLRLGNKNELAHSCISQLPRHSSSRLDWFASDIKTCKHVFASLGSYVIALRGLTAAVVKCVNKFPRCPTLHVIVQAHDWFASDIETCKHVSASLGSYVIPLRGLTAAEIKCESISGLSLDSLARHSGLDPESSELCQRNLDGGSSPP